MTVGIMPSSHYLARLPDEEDGEANAQMEDLLEEARRYHPDSPKAPLRRPAPEQHLPPVVLVEGFFSFFNEVRLSRPFPLSSPNRRLKSLSVLLGAYRDTPEC